MRQTEPYAFQYGHLDHADCVTHFVSFIPNNHEINTMIQKAVVMAEKAELKRARQE